MAQEYQPQLMHGNTDERCRADDLRAQAERCRRLSLGMGDARTVATLSRIAEEYEAEAAWLNRGG